MDESVIMNYFNIISLVGGVEKGDSSNTQRKEDSSLS